MLQRKTARATMGRGKFNKTPRRMIIPDFAHRLVRCTQYLKHAKAKRVSAGQNSGAIN